jgi:hypothetical protein
MVLVTTTVGILLALLVACNPSERQFTLSLKHAAANPVKRGTLLDGVSGRLMSEAVELDSRDNVRRDNYVFFSVFTYQGVLTHGEAMKYVGLLDQFVRLGGE